MSEGNFLLSENLTVLTELENFGLNCPKMALFGPKMDLGKIWGLKWPKTPKIGLKMGAFLGLLGG